MLQSENSLKQTDANTAADTNAPSPWSLRDTIIGAGFTLIPLATLSILSTASGSGQPPKHVAASTDLHLALLTFFVNSIIEAMFILAPFYYAFHRTAKNRMATLGLRGFHPVSGGVAIILGATGTLVTIYSYSAIIQMLHLPAQTNLTQLQQELAVYPQTLRAELLVAVFVAPIFEEIFFRGFLLQGLRHYFGDTWAVLISSLIFAIIHFSVGSFLLLLVLGIILGVMRIKTNSIWPGIILHALNNLISAVSVGF